MAQRFRTYGAKNSVQLFCYQYLPPLGAICILTENLTISIAIKVAPLGAKYW